MGHRRTRAACAVQEPPLNQRNVGYASGPVRTRSQRNSSQLTDPYTRCGRMCPCCPKLQQPAYTANIDTLGRTSRYESASYRYGRAWMSMPNMLMT